MSRLGMLFHGLEYLLQRTGERSPHARAITHAYAVHGISPQGSHDLPIDINAVSASCSSDPRHKFDLLLCSGLGIPIPFPRRR